MDNTKKQIPKKKLINKIRHKNKRRLQRLNQSYRNVTQDGSAFKKLMNDNEPQMDFDMTNQITTGHNRKMKKKMKKLKKKLNGENAEDKIFQQMQRYKSNVIKQQQKTLFNPVSLMDKRREKRMKRMEQNKRDMKKQVIHKNSKTK